MTSRSALIFATTAAIALASFDLRPAAAAPEGGPAIAKQNAGADDFSSQRRRRGRVHPGVPLAAFGAVVGTIAGIAAAQRQRDAYERYYYYAEPQYVAPPSYYYAQPQPYVGHYYAPPQAYHGGYGYHGYAAPAPSAPVYNNPGLGDGRL